MKKKKKIQYEKVKPTADRNQLRREFYSNVDSGKWGLTETVRHFRIMLGMSQKDFAEHTGVTPRAIMEFEQGIRNPTVKTLEKLLKGSGLTLCIRRSNNPYKG
jgi:DNA-binding XRE family transcriptional regulator